eukprot:PhF_6_TR40966/c0_g1_i1/m.62008
MTEVVSNNSSDLYSTLGLQRYAGVAEVRRAYRLLAASSHPDKNSDGLNLFLEINAAYEVLSNEESKEKYDRSLRRAVVQVEENDDTTAAIQRDREKMKANPRVPISAYTPGDDVMRQMKEMVTNDVTDTKKALNVVDAPQRFTVTEMAVDESLRVRSETNAERSRILDEIERLHSEAELDREKRRAERAERKQVRTSPPPQPVAVSSIRPPHQLNPLLRCEEEDRSEMVSEEESAR